MSDVQAPTDLRLVPAAAACWVAAGVAVGWDARTVVLAGAGVLGAVGVVVLLGSGPALTARLTAVAAAGMLLSRRDDAQADVRGHRQSTGQGASRGTAQGTAWLAVGAVAAVLASCAGQLALRDAGPLAHLVDDRATVQVVGTVRAEAVPLAAPYVGGGDRYRAVLAVEEVTGRGRTGRAAAHVLVLGGAAWQDVDHGARVLVDGRLGPVEAGEEVRGLLVARTVEVLEPPGPVDAAVNRLRASLLVVSDDLPPDARGLVPGAAVGDTSRVPQDLQAAMQTVSLTHITAVSGGHFAVLSVAVLGATAMLRLPRTVRAVTTGVVMAGFVLLVRPEPSVIRAAAMGGVAVVGLVLGRPSRAVPALAGAVVVLLLVDPWLARSFGFALSVAATAAIVLLGPPLALRFSALLPRWSAVLLSVPTAAQAVCAPIVVLLDPAVSPFAVPANLLAAPAVVPATLLGLVATLAAPWAPPVAHVAAQLAGGATWWIALVARTGAALPGAHLEWPAGPGGATGLAVLTAVALAVVLVPPGAARVRAVTVVALVLAALVVVVLVRPGALRLPTSPPEDWQVAMCDVGQGDTLVVRSGQRSAVVVDVGPDGGAADTCLRALGVEQIDLLVLTHHHADHVGGLPEVLAGREVTTALVSPAPEPAAQARATVEALGQAGVPIQVAARGGEPGLAVPGTSSAGTAGGLRWRVLWPGPVSPRQVAHALEPPWSAASAETESEGSEVNDASVVVLLEVAGLQVLALGDLEEAAQAGLLPVLETVGAQPHVVKVAHHGSARQSAELARRIAAPVALVGAGAGNPYGHPTPSAMALYRSAGSLVLSTHECGTVTIAVATDGSAVETVTGAARELEVSARCLV